MYHIIRKLIPHSLFRLFQPYYHYALSLAAAWYYRHPSRDMVVIGVTGTNGKSTVIEILRHIFDAEGFVTASLSSIQEVIAGEQKPNTKKMTMPGRFAMQHFLFRAKKAGATHVFLEATSEGMRQFRHMYIAWDGLVFTNLHPEHIESHGSFAAYKEQKESLFRYLNSTYRKETIPKVIVANGDDDHADDVLRYPADQKIAYTLTGQFNRDNATVSVLAPDRYTADHAGVSLRIEGHTISSVLSGTFNAENILAAIGLARAYDVSWDAIQKGIEHIAALPGRLEFVQTDPFSVVVDYAHTPDALENVYKTLTRKKSNTGASSGKLICVFGAAGGGRDKWKRKEFGSIAARYCDTIILTNEDPYDEDPEHILSDIRAGIPPEYQSVQRIIDRTDAIRNAIQIAQNGDTVAITGKGSELVMMGPDGRRIPWNDRQVVEQELQHIKNPSQ